MKFTTSINRKISGFTLIELLVVIAIIAILAAILFPVFARARENARRSSCQSNLKQLGLGVMQYVQDYDGFYPYVRVLSTPKINWGQSIYPYVKSTQLFRCPSNTTNDYVNGMGSNGPDYPVIPSSYSMNDRMGAANFPSTVPAPLHESALDKSAQKIVVAESSFTSPATAPTPLYGYWNWSTEWVTYGFAGHLGTANYLFFDGHVKSLRPTATVSPLNMYGQFMGNAAADGAGCQGYSNTIGTLAINCDVTPAAIKTSVAALDAKYNQ